MPLTLEERNAISDYCDKDVPSQDLVERWFDFIDDGALKAEVVREYLAARYIYKLGEALYVEGEKLRAHCKFQIVQYASIYEAVIVHLLWGRFKERSELSDIEYHRIFKPAGTMPKDITIQRSDGSDISLCYEARVRTSKRTIKFDDKVDVATRIGFIDARLGEELKEFFRVRNGVHIENAATNTIKYELEVAKLSFQRMRPFIVGVKGFIKDGALPEAARLKTVLSNPETSELKDAVTVPSVEQ